MVKLYESMATSFDKYLNEEGEENINECEISNVEEASILKESLENGKVDSKESEVLDKVFAYLRDLKSDEEFADFCLNKLEMTEEELKNFCGLNADDSESMFESVDESLNESAWDELKSFLR